MMGGLLLTWGLFVALASAAVYFTKLGEWGLLQNFHHAVLAVMILGMLLASYGGSLILKFRRDEI